jgi:hypothetical protein
MPFTFDKDLRLPVELRSELKKPLGLQQELSERPNFLVCIGDVTSWKLAGVKPEVSVFDEKIKRKPTKPLTTKPDFTARNPNGTITVEAVNALRTAIQNPPSTLFIDGEEDLLALPAVMLAPLGAVVAYGQPNEGLVLVEVTEEKKREVEALLKRFSFA